MGLRPTRALLVSVAVLLVPVAGWADSPAAFDASEILARAQPEQLDVRVTPLQAFLHYFDGRGRARRMRIDDIPIRGLKHSSFPRLGSLVVASSCASSVVHIDDRATYSVPGNLGNTLGTITLRLQGTLRKSKDCSWEFRGTIKAYDDTYDFNRANRSALKELMTRAGAAVPGDPYQIEIRGSRRVALRGVASGRPVAMAPRETI